MAKLYDYDAIVVGDGNPSTRDMTGFEVLKALKASKVKIPVLMVGNLVVENQIKALNVGADGYLTQPFRDALIAHMHAVVRRSRGHDESVLRAGELVVNLTEKSCEIGSNKVSLTGKEYQMLELLVLRKGKTIAERNVSPASL